MVSLLARTSRRGRDAARHPAVPLGLLAGAASLAVSLVGLLGLGLALVVVQTLDPDGGLGVGDSIALAGRLWLLAQGGELSLGSGPLVLAPLLLTLAIAWGLSQAGRGIVRLAQVSGPRASVYATGVVVLVHVLIVVLLAVTLDTADVGVGLLRTTAGAVVVGRRRGRLGHRPGVRARGRGARPPAVPGPPDAAGRAGGAADRDGAVHGGGRGRARLRRRGLREPVPLPGRGRGRGPRPARSRAAAAPERGRRGARPGGRPGLLRRARARSSRCTG